MPSAKRKINNSSLTKRTSVYKREIVAAGCVDSCLHDRIKPAAIITFGCMSVEIDVILV